MSSTGGLEMHPRCAIPIWSHCLGLKSKGGFKSRPLANNLSGDTGAECNEVSKERGSIKGVYHGDEGLRPDEGLAKG